MIPAEGRLSETAISKIDVSRSSSNQGWCCGGYEVGVEFVDDVAGGWFKRDVGEELHCGWWLFLLLSGCMVGVV